MFPNLTVVLITGKAVPCLYLGCLQIYWWENAKQQAVSALEDCVFRQAIPLTCASEVCEVKLYVKQSSASLPFLLLIGIRHLFVHVQFNLLGAQDRINFVALVHVIYCQILFRHAVSRIGVPYPARGGQESGGLSKEKRFQSLYTLRNHPIWQWVSLDLS